MKLKVKPEDFIVVELIDLPIIKKGPYTILKLQKRYWNTLDVIDFVSRKLSLPKNLFSRAGLKDRYSLSTQYISFKGNFKHSVKEKNFTLIPVGRAYKALTSRSMIGNSFNITLRSLTKKEVETISKNYLEINKYGIPNYFDEQRFGSARHRKGFFAKELMLKHYKGALQLLLCYSYKEDSRQKKNFQRCCQENWGKWHECRNLAPQPYRKIIDYLISKPNDYRNAIKAVDRELLNLYILAYQSYLFNQTVNVYVQDYGVDNVKVPYSVGHFIFYRRLKKMKVARKMKIPMFNEKLRLKSSISDITKSILNEEGIRLRDFGLQKMRFRGVRFKSFLRPMILQPKHFCLGTPNNDDLYKGLKKMKITFTLPPGSYATLLIKRLLI